MEPVPFPGFNRNLGLPGCYDLPIFTDGQVCVSKWKMTKAEIAELAKTGEIWLSVVTGIGTQPPVRLSITPLVTWAKNDPP